MSKAILMMMMMTGMAMGQEQLAVGEHLDTGEQFFATSNYVAVTSDLVFCGGDDHKEIFAIHEDGTMTVTTNMPLDEASRKFFDCVLTIADKKIGVIKHLAENGEICKVYGHRWEQGYYSDLNPVLIHAEKVGLEVCKICKATKTTKTVTEIKEAGDE